MPEPGLVDVLIIGGGIVGLATAHQLLASDPGLAVTVVDKEPDLAVHQTGHNSGVLHSGVYYRPGSLKARTCREGRAAMLDYCRDRGIAHEVTGKVIVATDGTQLPALDALADRAAANGVEATRIGPDELAEREPHAVGVAALHVPDAGIVDFVAVCRSLADGLREAGATIATGTEVVGLHQRDDAVHVETAAADGGSTTVRAAVVVSCAGLHSDVIARQVDPGLRERILPFRGEYYEVVPERRHLVNDLIYPVPDPRFPFLGVHLTRMIDGSIHAGPNAVLALAREGYRWSDVDPRHLASVATFPGWWRLAASYWRTGIGEYRRSLSKSAFVDALRRLVPELEADDLVPSPAGVRAQAVSRDGHLLDDFVWSETPRVVCVINAPSPAATASLAIGRQVAERAMAHLGELT